MKDNFLSISIFNYSDWSNHRSEWRQCTKCPLGNLALKHVLGRGRIPADVLFIGEAPGKTEDLKGLAFMGPAGKLLDSALEAATQEIKPSLRMFYGNLLACRPTDRKDGPNRKPEGQEVEECQPRLINLIKLVNPSAIALLGKQAQNLAPFQAIHSQTSLLLETYHPSYILRNGGIRSSLYPGYVKALRSFLEKVSNVKNESTRT